MVGEHWWIRQGDDVQGPFTRRAMLRFIRTGKATRDLFYSSNQVDWRPGTDVPELFQDDRVMRVIPRWKAKPPPLPAPPPRPSGHPDMEAYAAVFADGPTEPAGRRARTRRGRQAPVTVHVAAFIMFAGVTLTVLAGVLIIATLPNELGLGLWLFVKAAFGGWLAWLLIKGEPFASTLVLLYMFLVVLASLLRLSSHASLWYWLDVLMAGVVIAILTTEPASSYFRGQRGRRRRYRSAKRSRW